MTQHDTLPSHFVMAKDRNKDHVAFRFAENGHWKTMGWEEYFNTATKVAGALAALDIKPGDRVVIMSNTRYQWAIADQAILGLGCVTVPIYQSATPEDIAFILENSQAVAAFVEDDKQFQKFQQVDKDKLSVKHLFSFSHIDSPDVTPWEKLLEQGASYHTGNPQFFIESCNKVDREDLASIVYTSGTTGLPKGVEILHRCIFSECTDVAKVLELTHQDRTLTFLPFAHIFGRAEMWAHVIIGYQLCLAESIDRIAANLVSIKPTFMMAVPRIFEKLYDRIISQVDSGSPVKKKLFYWAVGIGQQVSRHKRAKKELPFSLLLQFQLASKLVFKTINEKLGGKIRYLVSGGAPLSKEIAEFFHASGILILEGYGLTETSAAVTVNTPYNYEFGTVGPPMEDVQVRIAEDGEVLVKSDKVFRGYYKNPEATAKSLVDGWFHTGDIGEIDDRGRLKITDRKKDLIKTAGGKMIAPQKIENVLKTSKYISQVVVYGDKMKYLVALVTLNDGEVSRFAQNEGISCANSEELKNHDKVYQLIQAEIKSRNSQLGSYETIKNFAILPEDFTVESGELTPSLKVKRKHLSKKYEDKILKLYA